MTVRIPEPLSRELKKLARDNHQPVSDLVRESVRRYVAVERFKALRALTVPYAQKAGFLTDEDVFKAVS
jgi:predicted transcriptional regulator